MMAARVWYEYFDMDSSAAAAAGLFAAATNITFNGIPLPSLAWRRLCWHIPSCYWLSYPSQNFLLEHN